MCCATWRAALANTWPRRTKVSNREARIFTKANSDAVKKPFSSTSPSASNTCRYSWRIFSIGDGSAAADAQKPCRGWVGIHRKTRILECARPAFQGGVRRIGEPRAEWRARPPRWRIDHDGSARTAQAAQVRPRGRAADRDRRARRSARLLLVDA